MPVVEFRGDRLQLSSWLTREYSDAIGSRRHYEMMLDEYDRKYEAKPRVAKRNFPWPNASNLEVPVGATHTDTVDSRLEDSWFSSEPFCSLDAIDATYYKRVEALQDYLNEIVLPASGYRQEMAMDILSMCKLGTGFQWLTYERRIKQVRNAQGTPIPIVTHLGPRQQFVHPRHLIVPQDARDIQNARWVTIRSYKTWGEIVADSYMGAYPNSMLSQIEGHGVSVTPDTKRLVRQGITNATGTRQWNINQTFCLYQSGPYSMPEDLWVTWHYPSGLILRAIYNPYSHARWPITRSIYMYREDSFNGIGIMAMLDQIQEEITDIHNYCLDNLLAANTIVGVAKMNSVKEFDISPMAIINYTGTDRPVFERLGQALSGQQVGEIAANGYAERRTGVGDSNIPRLSSFQGTAGVRTPATTTLALIGEGNKRFALALNNSKQSANELLFQYIMLLKQYWPLQARSAEQWNLQKAGLIADLFSEENEVFRKRLKFSVNASTTAMNRDSERQNALLVGNFLKEFNGMILQLVIAGQQAPDLNPLITKIIEGATEYAERVLRTFDVRDPERFLPTMGDIGTPTPDTGARINEEIDAAFLTGTPVGANGNGATRG